MHAVVDSERKERNLRAESIRLYQFQQAEAARGETRHAGLVGEVTNLEKQTGNKLTTTQFASRLRKLNRDLVIERHPNWKNREYPHLANSACLYLVVGDTKTFLMGLENDWLPEWSVMGTTTAKRPALHDGGWWKEETIPDVEVRRGWRTVLLRLVMQRVITLDAAEREFGSSDRPSWARLRRKDAVAVI